jgi:hypothetical protein
MTDNSRQTGAAIEAHYWFLVWLVPTIEKFPKSHRFTVGDRIQIIALDVLDGTTLVAGVEKPLPSIAETTAALEAQARVP